MKIDAGDGRVLVISGEDVVCDETASTADEVQFVTSTPYGDARILTERVLRLDNRFVTQRELDDQLVATGAVTQMPTAADNVEHEKRCGNQAFGNREYAQAAVHYTMAIDKMKRDGDGAREILLCNRSACFLKLGELEKAVDDAAQAALLNPGYCKAHFRHGLALHAQGKYREALPALGKALNMEPKNKQILDAVRFAEMRCARGPEVV
ncbi:hypothetical protein M885DRAFT_441450 [Pelagophyceae sp. CCMP2097]|nr:hypothetical protein M885DRAFT_441450 [Pelagophyceae sp. CCMP2097]